MRVLRCRTGRDYEGKCEMTREEIVQKRAEILSKIKDHENQIKHLRIDLKHIQIECDHSNKQTYSDARLGGGWDCPDCGDGG